MHNGQRVDSNQSVSVQRQPTSRAQKRRERRIKAAALRAHAVGQLPIRIHRSIPITITTQGEYIVIDMIKQPITITPTQQGFINAIPAGMESSSDSYDEHLQQWHKQLANQWDEECKRVSLINVSTQQ